MPQHPERGQQEGPERKTIADEDEAVGIRSGLTRFQRGLVHRVGCHCILFRETSSAKHVLRLPGRAGCRSRHPGVQSPSDPLVDGISSAARASMAIAVPSARAKPLKQDSAMWWSLLPYNVA